jgi:hypothetical protein
MNKNIDKSLKRRSEGRHLLPEFEGFDGVLPQSLQDYWAKIT